MTQPTQPAHRWLYVAWCTLAVACACVGCATHREVEFDPAQYDQYQAVHNVYHPVDADSHTVNVQLAAHETVSPPLDANAETFEYRDLKPEEAIQLALMNSTVLRDLGGVVVQSPQTIPTILGPAIRETDPRDGIEAALSAFDAQLTTSAFLEQNDRAVNNRFLAGPDNLFFQNLYNYQWELRKKAATGAEFSARHTTEFDQNNATGNLFPSAWQTILEGEIRQPLLRGAGTTFNRIAGPLSIPGTYNGVVIARINSDISLAEFQHALRELVSSVENSYWDLYFAYRDLEAKKAARDAALTTWQRIKALRGSERGGAEREAQAREQYYRFQEEVENAFSGRLVEGTQTNNGSPGGTFRGAPGVLVAERRLRLLIGVPINDGSLIRPAVDPALAQVTFHWPQITNEALTRRPEIHRQRLEVKRRELELIASKNFLLPQFDVVGRYRWRGFGEDYLDPNRDGRGRFDNAWMNLTSGDFQEWQMGVELTFPVGFRRAHAAVHHAKLQLARERAVLEEHQRQVLHDLSNAVSDMNRAYRVAMNAYNRRVAAKSYLALLQRRDNDFGNVNLFELLDAQRRATDADISYFRALVDYAVAIKNVHFEKGSLWEYNNVYLSEEAWAEQRRAAFSPHSTAEHTFDHTINLPDKNVPAGFPDGNLPAHPQSLESGTMAPLPISATAAPIIDGQVEPVQYVSPSNLQSNPSANPSALPSSPPREPIQNQFKRLPPP